MKITVAHDFTCPYCWVGWFQAEKLKREFGVEIEWLGYELWPEHLEWPAASPAVVPNNKPEVPTKLGLLLMIEQLEVPKVIRPPRMRTFRAHQAVEFAKTEGKHEELIRALYEAYWLEGANINDADVIASIAEGVVSDIPEMLQAIAEDRFGDQVVDFDDPAYAAGVYNVPTFFVGDQRIAEQPYQVIRKAMLELQSEPELTSVYRDVEFSGPVESENRPYVFLNMVSTLDGKIITGDRDEPVDDLGSKTDHFLMHRLERKADAVLVGAGSLRASGPKWNPKTDFRFVISKSGNVDCDSAYLSNGKPYVITCTSNQSEFPAHVNVIRIPDDGFGARAILERIRDLGVDVVNLLGGSIINAMFIREDVVDEMFLTIAPKLKLGEDVPTIADGVPLLRSEVKRLKLVEVNRIEDELFLRYRR